MGRGVGVSRKVWSLEGFREVTSSRSGRFSEVVRSQCPTARGRRVTSRSRSDNRNISSSCGKRSFCTYVSTNVKVSGKVTAGPLRRKSNSDLPRVFGCPGVLCPYPGVTLLSRRSDFNLQSSGPTFYFRSHRTSSDRVYRRCVHIEASELYLG